ncbi:hypothetical protein OS493_001244 [Desmophyllum pertusum]|uniref:Uncharacterized protein n=1 Tax=Desmophyllum pertusum TaxID=174260 RepID=A0A9W9ZXM3_9CNID|nr:hypothetical protein OS493_001244 [Desmophyllum pertusum]
MAGAESGTMLCVFLAKGSSAMDSGDSRYWVVSLTGSCGAMGCPGCSCSTMSVSHQEHLDHGMDHQSYASTSGRYLSSSEDSTATLGILSYADTVVFCLSDKQVEQQQNFPSKHHFIRCEASGLVHRGTIRQHEQKVGTGPQFLRFVSTNVKSMASRVLSKLSTIPPDCGLKGVVLVLVNFKDLAHLLEQSGFKVSFPDRYTIALVLQT